MRAAHRPPVLFEAGRTAVDAGARCLYGDGKTAGDLMGQLNARIVPVTPFEQNCTILFDTDTKTGVVVDPGGDVERLLDVIRDNDFAISQIWITHGHIDH